MERRERGGSHELTAFDTPPLRMDEHANQRHHELGAESLAAHKPLKGAVPADQVVVRDDDQRRQRDGAEDGISR